MSDPAPFISDAEYLACDSDWHRQRADAIAAQQESKRDRSYGRRWNPIAFCDANEWPYLRRIEKFTGKSLEVMSDHGWHCSVRTR